MPSLSNKPEPVVPTDPAEFSKTMIVMMEKKIRNLEKRKGRLEDYRAKQSKGQPLTDEQLKAVAKLDDVLSQIELLQDLTKQVSSYGAEVLKQQKKQQKRERFEQIDNERKRFAEVLHLQSILNALGAEETRQAFVDGTSGAVKLEEQELTHLDELYKILNPERGVNESLIDQLKASSEHLQLVLDAREKVVCGTTYRQLHDLISKIKSCPYFTETAVKSQEVDNTADANDTSTEKEFVVVESEEVPHADSAEVLSSLPPEVIPDESQTQEIEAVFTQHSTMPLQPSTDPTKTFEKIVENVQGRFNFIQDSEIDIDSPSHVDPAVVSVHPLPTQPYQQQANLINHSQTDAENSAFVQQTNDGFQQYTMQPGGQNSNAGFGQADVPPESLSMTNEMNVKPSNQTVFPQAPPTHSDGERNFDNGMTFESSTLKQQQQSADDVPQQRGAGQMRRGYRGGRGGNNANYGARGSYRGGADRGGGFRGGDRSGGSGERPRHHSPSGNNGYQSDNRRGGRGGSRGGSGGFRGSSRGGRGGSIRGGGFRGQHQQNSNVQ